MKVGKWYIVIGKMCMGFGTPPNMYLAQARTDKPSFNLRKWL